MTEAATAEKHAFTPEMISEVFAEPGATVEPVKQEPAKPAPEETAETNSDDDKVASRIVAAKRVEAKIAQQREDVKRREAEIAAREKAAAEREAEQKLLEEDPIAYFAKKGWGEKEYAAHLERLAGTAKPEAIVEKKLTEQEQRVKALEDQLAVERARSEKVEQSVADRQAGEAFVADVTANADKYPHLTQEFSETEAVQIAFAELRKVIGTTPDGKPVRRIDAFVRDNGRGPTHDEIAEYVDGLAKARIEARSKATWRKSGESAPTPAGKPSLGDHSSTPPAKGSSPRTLSRADTSQRPAAPRGGWSQEFADEESIRILEAAKRKG